MSISITISMLVTLSSFLFYFILFSIQCSACSNITYTTYFDLFTTHNLQHSSAVQFTPYNIYFVYSLIYIDTSTYLFISSLLHNTLTLLTRKEKKNYDYSTYRCNKNNLLATLQLFTKQCYRYLCFFLFFAVQYFTLSTF